MRKLLLTVAISALGMGSSAEAAYTLGAGGLAPTQSFTVNLSEGTIENVLQPGLTSEIKYTFNGITTNTEYSFFNVTAEVKNTSSAPVTGSRVSGFGFNTDPNTVLSQSSSSNVFTNVVNPGGFLSSYEFCATSGPICTGGGGGGATLGNSVTTVLSLAFLGNDVESIVLDDFFVRYQSINLNGGEQGFSGMGVVPLPAALPLLLSALAGLGVMARLRSARREDQEDVPTTVVTA